MGSFSTLNIGDKLTVPYYAHENNPIISTLAEDPISAAQFLSAVCGSNPTKAFSFALNKLFSEGMIKYRWFGCNADLVRAAVISLLYIPTDLLYSGQFLSLEVYPPTPLKRLLGKRVQIGVLSQYTALNSANEPPNDLLGRFWKHYQKHITELYSCGIPKSILRDIVKVIVHSHSGYVPIVYINQIGDEFVVTLS